MADEKKKRDYTLLKETPFFLLIVLTLLLFGFGLFGRFAGFSLYVGGKLLSHATFSALAVMILSAVVLSHMKRKDGSVKKAPFVVAVIILVLSACPLAVGLISDLKETSVSETHVVDADNQVLITEVTEHDKTADKDVTHMNVYKIVGIFAKKLGEIDERYYSIKALAEGKLVYEDDASVFKIECKYGEFGDERVKLSPEYDTGTLTYEFKLK